MTIKRQHYVLPVGVVTKEDEPQDGQPPKWELDWALTGPSLIVGTAHNGDQHVLCVQHVAPCA